MNLTPGWSDFQNKRSTIPLNHIDFKIHSKTFIIVQQNIFINVIKTAHRRRIYLKRNLYRNIQKYKFKKISALKQENVTDSFAKLYVLRRS